MFIVKRSRLVQLKQLGFPAASLLNLRKQLQYIEAIKLY